MSLLRTIEDNLRRGLPTLTAEISPPRLYLEIDRLVGIARRLRALGLDAIAVTNSTGGSYKFSPWAIVEDLQRAMAHVPLIIHLTARDEGSVRSVYYHLHEMLLKGVRDVLIVRGDPSPGSSKLLDSYRFTTTELIRMTEGYRRGSLIDGSTSEPVPDLGIFAAAHPEFPDGALPKHFDFIKKKIEAGANALIANIVTDVDRYLRYRDRAAAAGIHVPIMPSLLPLNSLRRCDFLAKHLHIPVPPPTIEALRSLDPAALLRFAIDDTLNKLQQLIRGGAPGANFTVIAPGDADSVVGVVQAYRSQGPRS